LPDKLFRWASGHQHREFGLAYLSDGHFLTGARLLLRALGEDPFATVRVGTERVCARYWRSNRLSGLLRAKLHRGTGGGIVKRKFLEVDPTAFGERPRATWTRRRLACITEFPVERLTSNRQSSVRLTAKDGSP
jgi:hypothetical protein